MTPAERAIVEDVIAQAWDDGFEHGRAVAVLVCTAAGRQDLAEAIKAIPLKKKGADA